MAESSTSDQDVSSPEDPSTHRLVHDTIVRWLRDEASLHVDRIDYDAPLFELGIDSLGAANIGGQLEEFTGKTLNPEVLYELETINELAAYLENLPTLSASLRETRPACSTGSPCSTGIDAAATACHLHLPGKPPRGPARSHEPQGTLGRQLTDPSAGLSRLLLSS